MLSITKIIAHTDSIGQIYLEGWEKGGSPGYFRKRVGEGWSGHISGIYLSIYLLWMPIYLLWMGVVPACKCQYTGKEENRGPVAGPYFLRDFPKMLKSPWPPADKCREAENDAESRQSGTFINLHSRSHAPPREADPSQSSNQRLRGYGSNIRGRGLVNRSIVTGEA